MRRGRLAPTITHGEFEFQNGGVEKEVRLKDVIRNRAGSDAKTGTSVRPAKLVAMQRQCKSSHM